MDDLKLHCKNIRSPQFGSSSDLCLRNSPIRLSDPDTFITFDSPNCYQEGESLLNGPFSPQIEDTLERTIKKLRLDADFVEIVPQKPEFNHLLSPQKETWEEENSIPFPYSLCPFAQSTQENTSFYKSSPSYNQNGSPCPINKPSCQEENEDDIIILDEMPENFENGNKEKRQSKCLRNQAPETLTVTKGAKAVYETKMLSTHEKLLWQSFAKVHSHIPNFPVTENKHFDYLSLVLRHKADHLFQIGRQNQQSYIQSKEERYKTPNLATRVENNPSPAVQKSTLVDPRLVFDKPQDQALMNKCPVMSDLFQKDKPASQPQNNHCPPINHPAPQTATINYHHHTQPHSAVVNPQTQNKNPSNDNAASLLRMLAGFHGIDFNNFGSNANPHYRAMMSLCPAFNKGQNQNSNKAPSRERRAAFSKAVNKIKHSSK